MEGEYLILIMKKFPAAKRKKNTKRNVQENHAENETPHRLGQPQKTGLPFLMQLKHYLLFL